MSKLSRTARSATRPPGRRKTAASPPKKAASKKLGVKSLARDDSRYHHGDLHAALLKAAQIVLERDGMPGLTLRAVAREAGVSHAAPSHHFGDLTGLVSELAAVGFRKFSATLNAASATGTNPMESSLARAKAYLGYARSQPDMYQLMFRTERLDMTRPALRDAANASFAGLASVIGIVHPGDVAVDSLTMEQAALLARTWSLVHGFAMLALDGRLNDILGRLPAGNDTETLFVEMLKASVPRPS